MFGVTTPCVDHARAILESKGFEVVVFHATGVGGMAMEQLIRQGGVVGVLDLTTTELADELVGGTLSAGPDRLSAAAEQRVPQVVSTGALDMVNFGPTSTIPERFADRTFHVHNPTVTLMRTTRDENARLGAELARQTVGLQGTLLGDSAREGRLGARRRWQTVLRRRSRSSRLIAQWRAGLPPRGKSKSFEPSFTSTTSLSRNYVL